MECLGKEKRPGRFSYLIQKEIPFQYMEHSLRVGAVQQKCMCSSVAVQINVAATSYRWLLGS